MAISTQKTIYLQHTTHSSFKILIPKDKEAELTAGWLLNEAINLLKEAFPKERKFSDIVALQTVNRDYGIDHWLSFPHKSLEILRDQTKLRPFYKQQTKSKSGSNKVCLDDFILEAKLGFGAFSNVYLVRKKDTGILYALKQIKKQEASPELILGERQAMLEIKSSKTNVLRYTFQTENFCYLVQDFMPCGDLHKLINRKKLNENEARFFVAEAILGLKAIHKANYIYRDLKPENLLLDFDGYLRFTDFGLAKKIDNLETLHYAACGTFGLSAPEIENGSGHNHLADYYNIGTLAFELITRKLPKFCPKERVFVEELNPSLTGFSLELRDFIKKLLQADPQTRLGAKRGFDELFEHPWIRSIDMTQLNRREVAPPVVFDPNLLEFEKLVSDISEIEQIDFDSFEKSTKIFNFSYYESASPSSLHEVPELELSGEFLKTKKEGELALTKTGSLKDSCTRISFDEEKENEELLSEDEDQCILPTKHIDIKAEVAKQNKIIKGFKKWSKNQKGSSINI